MICMMQGNTELKTLSIVILNWNVREMLLACLRALPDATGEWWARTETLVIDNASSDGSSEGVRKEFPDTQVISLRANRGFSGGNNVGIRASRGDFMLLLNPDTLPHPGSIARLCDYMAAHPHAGIVGPRLLNRDGTLQPSRRRFPTFLTGLLESTPLQRMVPNANPLHRYFVLDTPDDKTQDVGWLSGAALLCRREALRQAGLFDIGYFMFSEELDLCRRVSQTGWRVIYLPAAQIVHYGGGSTSQDVPARHINFTHSKIRYFHKHHGPLAGRLMRLYLLGAYGAQALSEAAKLAIGHKTPLRQARLRLYADVLSALAFDKVRSASNPKSTDVLLITGEYPPSEGGVGDYTCRLGLALEEIGVKNRALTLPPPQPQPVGVEAGPTSPLPNSIPLVIPRVTLRRVLAALRGTRSSVAHIQYQTVAYAMRPTVNLLPIMLRFLWRGKVVVTFHDLRVPYLFPKAGALREWANRLMARASHVAIATNPDDAARLRDWGVRRVRLIPIGSNIRNSPPAGYRREEWRAVHGLGPDTTLLAYFGFLNSSKGLDDLLRALRILREEGDYRLLMVGGGLGSSDSTNASTSAALDKLAGELGIRERLIWTGYLPPQEVSAALLASDLAALPFADGASFRRGSLLAILEHALPLITTLSIRNPQSAIRNPHWPNLVHGKNALLVPPGDPQALAASIRRLAADPHLQAELSAGARQLAPFFRWEAIAKQHADVYRTALSLSQA